MILQALCGYYDRLLRSKNPNIALEGFSSEKAHFALVIDTDGNLLQVKDLRETKEKKSVPRQIIVPQGPKKSSNIAASFLWGSTSYVLGVDDKGKPERTRNCHKAFKDLHHELLASSTDDGAKALMAFLSKWNPNKASQLELLPEMLKGNLVFQLDGDMGCLHDRPALKNIWIAHTTSAEKGPKAMCLISGEVSPIARLHPAIKGVFGAQSSGANIISFNLDAFCSYGKEQNYNAPISTSKASAYSKALNHLLASDTNKIKVTEITTVFWTERDTPIEGFLGLALNPGDNAAEDKELAVFLETIREGKFPNELDPNINFYILGLSPNASRLSVRFWYVSTVKDIGNKLGQHFRDLAIAKSYDNDPEFPGIWRLLNETANKKSEAGPQPLLAGAVMQSILNGTPYPQALLSAVIGRIRADQTINYLRAAIIKAVLVRKRRILNQGTEVSMALDKNNKDVAYLLGRLFAVLEKAQEDAIPGANATIKDRFYGSASATPRVVFPQLLRLAQHHIQKAEYGKVHDKQIEEILSDIQEFPAHLALDQQGLFAIGYYHQRRDFYAKKEN